MDYWTIFHNLLKCTLGDIPIMTYLQYVMYFVWYLYIITEIPLRLVGVSTNCHTNTKRKA